MQTLAWAALWVLVGSWAGFSGLLAWNHFRVRNERRRRNIPEEKPALRDTRSMHGLILEGLSFLIAFLFLDGVARATPLRALLSMAFGVVSVALVAWALRHLDMEWRIKAVVTEDHRFVTTGPYGVIRHPIFAALFSLLLATVLLLTRPAAALAAIAVYLWGTEIRIRAEDGLLERRFGRLFRDYRRATPAYLPFLR